MAELVGNRYQHIEDIGAGGMGVVSRAVDPLTRQVVAVKRLTAPKENLRFTAYDDSKDLQVSLAKEFQILASLRHPNIISVLDYGFDETRQPYFVMEYLPDAQTINKSCEGCSLEEQVDLLLQMLQALVYLHRRGIIHRDLKPDNVLVVNKQVKVLDFGLAVTRSEQVDDGESVSGTLAYMAPEVLLGTQATAASDLYAVGMISYELLHGEYPFKFQSIPQLLGFIMNKMPEIRNFEEYDVIAEIIMRLLAKAPEDRLADANEVFRLLSEAIGREVQYDENVRESFLQAAEFVGRERELLQLCGALDSIAEDHRGSIWLIGGESGVGKTRLLDEIRIRALVSNVRVLRGQEIVQGSISYQVWRDILRSLSLTVTLSDVEMSVLKTLIPDLPTLLQRPIADAPEIQPQDARRRLLEVIVHIFQQQRQPLVIILEDMQWSSEESLEIVRQLTAVVKTLPVLLIGSYRNDERPNLPSELPGANVMHLERLDTDSIGVLIKSMIGEVERSDEIFKLVSRETEGNAFFIVEVVRALMEEIGHFDRLDSTKTLPRNVLSGGMKALIKRRLNLVPEAARQVLKTAAAGGRVLDVKVLQAIYPAMNFDQWLTTCSDANILGVQENRWWFVHDKLREVLVEETPAQERSTLHRTVAEAVERVYHDNLEPHFASLSHHWREAQDVAKEFEYTRNAGIQSLKIFATHEAVRYFTRALELTRIVQGVSSTQLAFLQQQLGEAYQLMGQPDEAEAAFLLALKHLKQELPPTTPTLILKTLGHLGTQFWHRMKPAALRRAVSDPTELRMTCEIYERLSGIYFLKNRPDISLYATIAGLNLAEKIGISPELARSYSYLCAVGGLIPIHPMARLYRRLAHEMTAKLNDPAVTARVNTAVGVYTLGTGQLEEGNKEIGQAVTLYEQTGNLEWWGTCAEICARGLGYEGKIREARNLSEKHLKISTQREDPVQQTWSLSSIMETALHLQDADLHEVAQRVLHLNEQTKEFGPKSKVYAVLAFDYVERGELQKAEEAANTLYQIIHKERPTSFGLMHTYTYLVHAHVSLWEAKQGTDSETQKKQFELSLKLLENFAKVFPLAQSPLLRYKGLQAWLNGDAKKAMTLWEQALKLAQNTGALFEQGAVYYEMGRHLPETDARRMTYLDTAKTIFEKTGSLLYQRKVQSILNNEAV